MTDCFMKMLKGVNANNILGSDVTDTEVGMVAATDLPDEAVSGTIVTTPIIEPATSSLANLVDPSVTTTSNGMEPVTVSSITILSSFTPAGQSNNLDKYVYNVPDGLEKNPELLRAELLFYNTPQVEEIAEDVYTALTNVQEQCEVDFQKYCEPSVSYPTAAEYVDLHDLANSMMPTFTMFMLSGRRRHLAATSGSGKALINSFRSYYLPQSLANNALLAPLTEEIKKEVSHEAKSATGLVAQQVDSKNTIETLKAPTSVRSNVMINGRLSKEGRRFADGHLMPNKRRLHDSVEDHEHSDGEHEHDHHDHHDHPEHHDHDHRDGKGDGNSNNPPRPPVAPPTPAEDPRGPPIGPGGKKPVDGNDLRGSNDPRGRNDPRDRKPGDGKDPRGPPAPPRGKNPPPPPPPPFEDEDEEDEDPRGPHHGHHHGPPPPNPWEDRFFPGALGFGAGGDMCMYDNVDSLSSGCVEAIGNVHALREQYWNDQVASSYHHHHPHFLVAFLAIVGLVSLVKKCCFVKRRKQVKELLVGLNGDAELKAAVENRLGVVIPEVRACPHSRQSCFSKVLTFLGVFIFSLIASFVITITSLEMTAGIVHHIDENNADGEPTSPGVALTILFALCTAQVGLLSLAVYQVKKCCARNEEQFAPSAPTAVTPTVIGGTDNTTPGVQYIPMQFRNWITPRISAMSTAITSFSRRITTPVSTPSGYAPLLGDETEMIAVGSTHGTCHGNPNCPRYAVYTGVPINAATTTVVPVQATPVTAVHFV